jgi:DNA-binding response OmpR family regulator
VPTGRQQTPCCTQRAPTVKQQTDGRAGGSIRAGDLAIDPDTYAAELKGRPLALTYREFELLKFLAQHPSRVFTRDQLLREVWGSDYIGGTRTVDVGPSEN